MPPELPATIGRYTVQRVLGRGGMGTVYLATDPLIEREVAIKVLPAAGADAYEERLLAEARVSGRLVHPNIVGVFDIGEEHGQPFVVMPFVEGRTLAAILTDAVRPAMAVKVQWMIELCDALAYAHERRVIHRDIKPSNLLVDERGLLRVLDFGIAKVLTTSQIQFTSVGTPAYMAPEQYSSDPVDPRTDVFSAGLVLYEVLTHRRALTGTTPAQIYGQLMAGPLPRVLAAAPDVDPALAAVCEQAMAREPRDRFQTARAFGDALAAVRARRATARSTVGPAAAESVMPSGPPTAATVPAGGEPGATPVPPMAPVPSAAPAAAAERQAPGWRTVVTTTRWRFTLPAAAASGILAAVLVFGPARSAAPPPGDPVASPPLQASSPAPTLLPTEPSTPSGGASMPASTPSPAKPPAQTPGPPAIGRLRVSSDLEGTSFATSPVLGRGVITLSPLDANVLSPARYEVRAAYIDREPFMGNVDHPTTARQTVDVVAGQTATVQFHLETLLWRDRFERALVGPAARGRAAMLDRTYRRLKELSSTTGTDEIRFNAAAGEQQLVTFVKGDFTTDGGLFERHVRYTRVDVVRLDGAAQRIALIGDAPGSVELTRGRHEFAAVVEAVYVDGPPQSMTCGGYFDVPGGPSALQLKVDAIVRRPPKQDGKVAADCQIGGTSPLRSNPQPPSSLPSRPPTFTVLISADGSNVAGATVQLEGQTGGIIESRVTDAQGKAEFPYALPGRYRVIISLRGYVRVSEDVYIQAGAPKRLLVTLRPL